MHVEGFSEYFSAKDGTLRRMDARAKLVFTGLCLMLALISGSVAAPLVVGAVCLGLLAASGARPVAVLIRMAEPLFFAAVLAAFQAVLTRGDALFSFGILGWTLTVSVPGLHKGLLIMSRVFGGVSAVLFLTMTTPAHRLLSAAARLKTPKPLVEISLLAYRYVFVMLEDAVTVYQAQKGRLGYSGIYRGVGSLATLAGSVFLRAFDQAEATGEAMALRGYTGEYVPACSEALRPRDAALLCSLFSLCLFVSIWTS